MVYGRILGGFVYIWGEKIEFVLLNDVCFLPFFIQISVYEFLLI